MARFVGDYGRPTFDETLAFRAALDNRVAAYSRAIRISARRRGPASSPSIAAPPSA